MNQHPEWTQAEIDTLRRMRTEGKSYGQIALATGKSRNAVAGKVLRLGLAMPSDRVRERLTTPRVCRSKPPKPVVVKVSAPRPAPAPQPVVSLAYARPFMSRASRECAWLLDDGRSCCAPTVSGGSWCGAHRALVYRPTAKLDGEKMARRFG